MLELIILFFTGILFISIGWLLWKKEKITLIHEYHYTKVNAIDKKSYTKLMGIACLIIGVGMFLTGIFVQLVNHAFGYVLFFIFLMIGLVVMIVAQYKYNGGIF